MKKLILIPIIAMSLFSCGPSQEEIEAAEQAKKDSVEIVLKDTLEKQEVKKDSVIAIVVKDQKHLKQKLAQLKSEYEKECVKLEDIKGHKFLRSKHKKENDIKEQTALVEQTKKQIQQVEKQLATDN